MNILLIYEHDTIYYIVIQEMTDNNLLEFN